MYYSIAMFKSEHGDTTKERYNEMRHWLQVKRFLDQVSGNYVPMAAEQLEVISAIDMTEELAIFLRDVCGFAEQPVEPYDRTVSTYQRPGVWSIAERTVQGRNRIASDELENQTAESLEVFFDCLIFATVAAIGSSSSSLTVQEKNRMLFDVRTLLENSRTTYSESYSIDPSRRLNSPLSVLEDRLELCGISIMQQSERYESRKKGERDPEASIADFMRYRNGIIKVLGHIGIKL